MEVTSVPMASGSQSPKCVYVYVCACVCVCARAC